LARKPSPDGAFTTATKSVISISTDSSRDRGEARTDAIAPNPPTSSRAAPGSPSSTSGLPAPRR
jgi:hypothetical protein